MEAVVVGEIRVRSIHKLSVSAFLVKLNVGSLARSREGASLHRLLPTRSPIRCAILDVRCEGAKEESCHYTKYT